MKKQKAQPDTASDVFDDTSVTVYPTILRDEFGRICPSETGVIVRIVPSADGKDFSLHSETFTPSLYPILNKLD